jgi:hypothetical protein
VSSRRRFLAALGGTAAAGLARSVELVVSYVFGQ